MMQLFGNLSVFIGGTVLIIAWLIIAWPMRDIPSSQTAK
jgi:hypothetical protein